MLGASYDNYHDSHDDDDDDAHDGNGDDDNDNNLLFREVFKVSRVVKVQPFAELPSGEKSKQMYG